MAGFQPNLFGVSVISSMVKMIKNSILKFVNAPEGGVRSSQTLYESLFYAVSRYCSSKDLMWFDYSNLVAKEIVSIQLDDGGFDIGYDFIFGKSLRKSNFREPTSPELLSVTALAVFVREFENKLDEESRMFYVGSINKGVEWVLRHVKKVDGGLAIPYAPLSYSGVHITNATSFALSALAASVVFVDNPMRKQIIDIVHEMCRFMHGQLMDGVSGGKYWPYFYSGNSINESLPSNNKIDNYHIAQQLYHHCLAQKFAPSEVNYQIIESVSAYLLSIQSLDGFVPYTIVDGRPSDKVDLWGFSSLISAYLEANRLLCDRRLLVAAESVKAYIFKYCRFNDHFIPILINSSKSAFDTNFYPRSDAWVIHGISSSFDVALTGEDVKFCDRVFEKIVNCNFTGLENHTLTVRKLIFSKFVGFLKRIVKPLSKKSFR